MNITDWQTKQMQSEMLFGFMVIVLYFWLNEQTKSIYQCPVNDPMFFFMEL